MGSKWIREVKAALQVAELYLSYASGYRLVPRPVILHWILTYSCNCNCAYCGRGNLFSERRILDERRALSLLDQAIGLGVKYVAFTGGEPLLYGPLYKLASYAKRRGVGTILNTNGLLVSDENCRSIARAFDYVVVSVDTLDSGEFDRLRMTKGGLDAVLASVSLLCRHMGRRNLFINVLVHGKNINGISRIVRHFSRRRIPILMQPVHNSCQAKLCVKSGALLDTSCAESSWKGVLDGIRHTDPVRKAAIREYYAGFPLFFRDPKGLAGAFKCFAGAFSFFANPYGDIFACEERPAVAGNIRNAALKDIWLKMQGVRKYNASCHRDCVCWYQYSALNSLFLTRLFRNPVRTLRKEL